MIKTKYLIIGAGITGLFFASLVDNGSYIIVEKENEIGGYCKTIEKDGFIWDYAGHFFHFKNDENKKFFTSQFNSDEIVLNKKKTGIKYKKQIIDYPFQFNIHQLEKDEFIECLVDLFETDSVKEPLNFKELLYKEYGKGISERFLIPYNAKLYACDLNTLDLNAMGRFFPVAKPGEIVKGFKKSLNNSYNEIFLYPKKGAKAFINKIYHSLDKDRVFLNNEVREINIKEKIAKTESNIIQYEFLINTVPLNHFVKLSRLETNIDFNYNQVLVFNLGFDLPSNLNYHWLYFPEESYCFYRVGFYSNILHTKRMSLYVELGFVNNQDIDVASWLRVVLLDLKKAGIITNHKLVSYTSVIMNPAYVHISCESQESINRIFEQLSLDNVYAIGRYGAWTYCSIEDCMEQAKKIFNVITHLYTKY